MGKTGDTKMLSQICGVQFRQPFWLLLPRVQNLFYQSPRIFFGKSNFFFLSQNVPHFYRKLAEEWKEWTKVWRRPTQSKNLFFSKSLEVANLLWNESSKTFFLTSLTTLHYRKLLSKFKKFEKLKKVSFKKHASTFLKGIFNEFWRREKSRRLPGVLFFVKFTTWDENIFQHNLERFYPKLARCFRFWDHVRSRS